MKTFIGIDLGSTTTKAVVIDEARNVLGRGITNSRSNYDTAAAVAKQEALVAARFHLFRDALDAKRRAERRPRRLPRPARARLPPRAVPRAARRPRGRVRHATCRRPGSATGPPGSPLRCDSCFRPAEERGGGALRRPARSARATSSATSPAAEYLALGEQVAKDAGVRYDQLLNVFDRSIIEVENRVYGGIHLASTCSRRWSARSRCIARRRGPRRTGFRARSRACSTSARGDLRGRHRLRPRAAAVLQGAHPLRDPLPRPGRARHVPEHRARCSTSAARTPRRSRSTRTASSSPSR